MLQIQNLKKHQIVFQHLGWGEGFRHLTVVEEPCEYYDSVTNLSYWKCLVENDELGKHYIYSSNCKLYDRVPYKGGGSKI